MQLILDKQIQTQAGIVIRDFQLPRDRRTIAKILIGQVLPHRPFESSPRGEAWPALVLQVDVPPRAWEKKTTKPERPADSKEHQHGVDTQEKPGKSRGNTRNRKLLTRILSRFDLDLLGWVPNLDVIIIDVVGFEKTYQELLGDILKARSLVLDKLPRSALNDRDVLSGGSQYVAILAQSGYEFIVAFLAVRALGGAAVPLVDFFRSFRIPALIVERSLMDLPYISEACVLGVPYYEAKNLCGAVVRLKGGYAAAD
ncbi:hypothetical protein PT974_01794 [Cladobotryum mycophilum]|uniref:Uncharacterized protein n=1 Tax=Cladobotryum mycophilum TaxID=491253 RepID=A0ABR0SW93_9HYPO